MQTKCVLTADIGSSSLKAALINIEGKVLAFSRIPYSKNMPAFFEAKEWEKIFFMAAEECLSKCDDFPSAICISGNGPTLVSQDSRTLLWSYQVLQKGPSLFLDRILYFINNFTESFSSTKYLFSGPEYLIYQLTGRAVTILPEERFLSAYWTEDLLKNAGLSPKDICKIPPFVKSGSYVGEAFLKGKKVPLFAGSPDFVSALLGTACTKSGALCDRAGSSEGLNLVTDRAIYKKGLRTLPSAVPALWNLSFLIEDSGKAFEEYKKAVEKDQNKIFSYQDFIDLCLENKNFLEGKMIMKNLALKVKEGLGILKEAFEEEGLAFPKEMAVTGGQAKNEKWLQFKSSVCGMKLLLPECSDAELLGDAVFAFCGLGDFKNFSQAAESLCKIKKVILPQDFKEDFLS